MIIPLLTVVGFCIFITAIYSIVKDSCKSISTALSYAFILAMAVLSLSIQAAFMLGVHHWFWIFDIAIGGFSLFQIIKHRNSLKNDLATIFIEVRQSRLFTFLVLPVLGYLFAQALFFPPANIDSMVYNLARVFMFIKEGSLFIENYSIFHQAAFPVGFDLLSFLFLRFNSDFGLATFSFISYLTIIVATYSLIKAYFTGEPEAGRLQPVHIKTVSFIIASMIELVLQATSTKNDIPAAATALVIFLAGYHYSRSRKPLHLYVLVTALLWGITIKGYFPGFALPFVLYFAFYFFIVRKQRISIKPIKKRITRRAAYLLIPLGLLLCIAVFYGVNFKRFGNIWGEAGQVELHQNQDGFAGATVNMARYIAQATDIPILFGYKLNEIHDKLLGSHRVIAMRHKAQPVDLAAKPFISEDYSWYGPLGFLLALPAVLLCIFIGRDYIRLLALTLASFFAILSYKIAWMPWNNRFFAIFFAASGLCIAYVYQRYLSRNTIIRKIPRGIIVAVALYCLISAVLLNDNKPSIPRYGSANLLVNTYKLAARTIRHGNKKSRAFTWLKGVKDRHWHYKKYYPAHMFKTFFSALKKNKKVLVMGEFIPVFPLYISRPDLDITVSKPDRVSIGNTVRLLENKTDYSLIKETYDYIMVLSNDVRKNTVYTFVREEEQIFYAQKGAIFKL